ncbi:MAG: tRNA (adenosine(37)-N6)-threonylcarbamoyltransferase complex dimerization subunit type 1 TsaB [Acidimicrobiaceae bacterium]|nr:tRNA (adenosine(37)-N6)-threonylcarbamoyltransferase complex dimerization subunit type 1 TsaB [Acidimicrobiaceae bacterium]
MKILALETATPVCAIGLSLGGGESLTWILDEDRRHTEVLISGISRVLAQFDLRVGDLDRIVVDRGPGLFTGLRVGLASAGALAAATGVGLIGVTSLELLADGARRGEARGELLVAVDGRRGEVFHQSFVVSETEVRALNEPGVARPETLVEELRSQPGPRWLTGDGVARYRDLFVHLDDARIDEQTVPSLEAALAFGETREPGGVTPLYLREADAVARFVTREGS